MTMTAPTPVTAMKSNSIVIPLDIAHSVLNVLQTTTPRGNAHAEELLRIYHSLAESVVLSTQRNH